MFVYFIWIIGTQSKTVIRIFLYDTILLEISGTQIITYLFCSATNSNLIITDRRYSENLIEPIGPFSERSRVIINKTAIWINIQVSFILQHSIFRSRTHLNLTAILELKSFTGSNVHLCFTFSTLLGGNNDYTVSTARTIHGSSRSILQYLHGLNIMVTQEWYIVHKHSINHIERIAIISSTDTTNAHFRRATRSTACRDKYTGHTTLQRVSHIRCRNLFQIIALDRTNSTGQVWLQLQLHRSTYCLLALLH